MIKNASKLGLSSGSLLVPGRCRLGAIQLAATDLAGSGRASPQDFNFNDMKIEFSDGSDSGDVLFGFCLPIGSNFGWSIMPYYYEFGNGRILFPNGIYSKAITGTLPDPDQVMVSVFYE